MTERVVICSDIMEAFVLQYEQKKVSRRYSTSCFCSGRACPVC